MTKLNSDLMTEAEIRGEIHHHKKMRSEVDKDLDRLAKQLKAIEDKKAGVQLITHFDSKQGKPVAHIHVYPLSNPDSIIALIPMDIFRKRDDALFFYGVSLSLIRPIEPDPIEQAFAQAEAQGYVIVQGGGRHENGEAYLEMPECIKQTT